MRSLLPFILVGVATGSIYGLAGIGLVLTYKTSGIFNFAHGAQAAAAAYLFYELRDGHGVAWPVAMLLSLVGAGLVLGLLIERLGASLANAPIASRVAATIGLLAAIQGLILLRYGAATRTLRSFLPTDTIHLPGVNVGADQVIVTALVGLVVLGLLAFFSRARLGVAMQAVVEDSQLLTLQGIEAVTVRRWAWILGSCVAAISGVLIAPTIGLDVGVLSLLVTQAFGAAAIGSFSSLGRTYLGGLALGVGAALATRYLASYPGLRALPANLPFLVLFVALLVTPGRILVDRGIRNLRQPRPPAPLPAAVRRPLAAGAVVVLFAVPWLVGSSKLPLYTNGLVYVVLFISLSLLVRTSGQVSLCHMAFAAVGAATFAHLTAEGVPWIPAVLLGGMAALPVGAAVALPAIRLSGVFLAVATFGFGLLVERLAYKSFLLFGLADRLPTPRPVVTALGTASDRGYYYVVLVIALCACGMVLVVQRSRLGRMLRGLADSPLALEAHGANPNLTILFVFCLSAFLAGIAGAVAGPVTGSVNAVSFPAGVSLLLVAVLTIAGRRPIVSSFVAAGAYAIIPGYFRSADANVYAQVAFGVAAMLAAVAPQLPWSRLGVSSKRVYARAQRRGPVEARRARIVRGIA